MSVYGAGVITLDTVAAYPTLPQLDLNGMFLPDSWHFANLSAALTVYVSFDGVTDHIALVVGSATAAIPNLRCSFKKVWLRKINAAGNASAMATALTNR